jgi:hypothetical protein
MEDDAFVPHVAVLVAFGVPLHVRDVAGVLRQDKHLPVQLYGRDQARRGNHPRKEPQSAAEVARFDLQLRVFGVPPQPFDELVRARYVECVVAVGLGLNRGQHDFQRVFQHFAAFDRRRRRPS